MRAGVAVALAALCVGCPSLRTYYQPSAARLVAADVAYGPGDKQRVDLWAPEGARGAPLVVFVHGGGWRSGDRVYFQPATGLYGNVAKALGDEGIATALPSYRYWPDVATLDAMLDDVAAAIAAAIARAPSVGADPRAVFLAGHSAGAHLVALLGARPELLAARGVDPSAIRGVVGISTPLDMERAVRTSKNPAVAALFGAAPEDASPLRFLRGGVRARGARTAARSTAGSASPPPTSSTPSASAPPSPIVTESSSPLSTPSSSPAAVESSSSPAWLFLVGEHDYPRLRDDFRDARDLRLRDATFLEVPGRTHEEMVLELGVDDDPTTRAIARFVRAVVGARESAAATIDASPAPGRSP